MSKLGEIKERWKYFLEDTWSPHDQAITGHATRVFAPILPEVLLIIKRDGWEPGTGIVVCAVADTAPLVHQALMKAPEDIAYLLSLLDPHAIIQ